MVKTVKSLEKDLARAGKEKFTGEIIYKVILNAGGVRDTQVSLNYRIRESANRGN